MCRQRSVCCHKVVTSEAVAVQVGSGHFITLCCYKPRKIAEFLSVDLAVYDLCSTNSDKAYVESFQASA